ncbi:MAG: cytochrome c3 family protein [Ignavibacteriales bacterium]|nr:cytochrome c3 family protein [Ignavibacteriales bacterium]
MRKRFFNLSIYFITISFILGVVISAQKENKNIQSSKEDHCYSCHKEIDNLPKDFSENDIHRHANISCSSCHGGDPTSDDQEIAMSPSKGFVGVPKHKDIPKFCGKCHSDINVMRVFQPRIETDQVEQYYTSVHGKKLLTGDENVAECASCHSAHSILPAKDPRSTVYALNVPGTCNKCHGNSELMKKYNLPSNQLEEYSKSVHGVALLKMKDVGAPACNDCHGNHGAIPPGVTSISNVCGTCHVSNMEYFNSTKMSKAFEEQDFHGCEQCHGNHAVLKPTDEMIGVGKDSKCVECHSSGDEGYAAAKKIYSSLTNLKNQFAMADAKYLEVKKKGMNDIEIGFLLQDAKQALIQSRTLIHTFDSTKVSARTNEGIAISNKASLMAQKEIDEYYTRRNGFAVATLVFLLVVVALYLKIKDKEKKTTK